MPTGFWWGNLTEKTTGRPRRRSEDNTEIDKMGQLRLDLSGSSLG
jgi:hypothetical protein